MDLFKLIKKYDKVLVSSFTVMLLVTVFFFALSYNLDKSHDEKTQDILYNTKTLPNDSKKIDLMYRDDINEMLEYEGSSLEEVRIIEEDSNRIFNMYFNDGIKDVKNGSYELAYQNFSKSVMFDQNSSVSYTNAASSLIMFKGVDAIDEALGYMEIAYSIDPNSSIVNYNYGYILFKKSAYDPNATIYLENATKINPEDKLAWKYLALSSYYTENYELSKNATEKALEMMPNDELMWGVKIILSEKVENPNQRLNTYNLVITKYPQYPNIDKIWFKKALIYAQKGEYEEMMSSFNSSMEINPLMKSEILEIYLDLIEAEESNEILNVNSTNEVIVIKGESEIIPSLIYNETTVNNKIESANIVFFVSDKQAKYELAFADSEQPIPPYRMESWKMMEYEGKPMKLLWYYVNQMEGR